jgi:hypothetical protein
MQIYVIVLVRSEVMKLEKKLLGSEVTAGIVEEAINVPDTVTLL